MSSIKKNFLYSSVLTVSNYLFPLLTYPYISRVLGVSNIGLCNFVDNIVNYFILFSMLGMSVVGIREIASVKDDTTKLNKTFSELFVFSLISTIVATIVFLVSIFFIQSLQQYRELLLISLIKLIGNFFLIEWFYKGIEDFKYITNRTILVKILYVVSVFCFVRDVDDFDKYVLLTSLMVAVNAFFNCIYARKKVCLSFSGLNIKPYVKPNLILGFQFLLTSMYTSINVVYLGFVSNTTEVGYYTTATKLYSVIIAFYQAYTGVLLPRMSALHSNNDDKNFIVLVKKSVNILLAFLIPIVIYSMFYSAEIIQLISGDGYEGAVLPSIIIYPLMFIIGYDQIMMIQILMPLRQDRALLRCAISGAIIGIICNIIFVPFLYSIGSSITWLCSELAVVITAQYYVCRCIKYPFPYANVLKYVVYHAPLIIIFVLIEIYTPNFIISLVTGGISMVMYIYVIQKLFLKNEVAMYVFEKLKI